MIRTPFSPRLSTCVRRLVHRTHGQDLIEYALLAAIASTVVIAALDSISIKVADQLGAAVTEIATRTAAAGTVPGSGDDGGSGNGQGNGSGSGGRGNGK